MAEGVFEGLFRKKGPVKKGCGVQACLLLATIVAVVVVAWT